MKITWKTPVLIFSTALLMMACTDQQLMQTRDILSGTGAGAALSTEEVAKGLKEALSFGTKDATALASKLDGFKSNPKIRIPFPPEAIKVRNTAMDLGLGAQVDKFETTLNRSAEEAAKSAAPIFLNAIKGMSIQDAFDILKGQDDAATNYLRSKTYQQLYSQFKPKVEAAVGKMKVGEHWDPISKAYNASTLLTGGEKINPDLNDYVTSRAVDGLFVLLTEQEQKIRENPQARVTDLLKKVFAAQD